MPVDPILSRLLEEAKNSYRDRDFKTAMDLFSRILDKDKNQWESILYLAMCYYKLGMVQMSLQRFRYLSENCPERDIREKATAAMGPIKQEAAAMMTITELKKPDFSKYIQPAPAGTPGTPAPAATSVQSYLEDDGDEDIEWAPKDNRNFT